MSVSRGRLTVAVLPPRGGAHRFCLGYPSVPLTTSRSETNFTLYNRGFMASMYISTTRAGEADTLGLVAMRKDEN